MIGQAIIKALKDDQAVSAAVGGRIHDTVPADQVFPHIRYGMPIATPFGGGCWQGESIRITIHTFSEAPDKYEALRIMGMVRAALHDKSPAFDDFDNVILLEYAGSQLLPDAASAKRYHGVTEFNAATAEVVE
jgi:hypothetical protein